MPEPTISQENFDTLRGEASEEEKNNILIQLISLVLKTLDKN